MTQPVTYYAYAGLQEVAQREIRGLTLAKDMPTPRAVVDAVSKVTGLGYEDMRCELRRDDLVFARDLCMVLISEECSRARWDDGEIARLFNRDRTVVIRARRRRKEWINQPKKLAAYKLARQTLYC